MDIRYLLALDPDRLLAPYLKEAGLEPKANNYPNWESTGLDGHIGGHYLSALSYMYAATGNHEIGDRLDYMLSELKRCQDAAGDGYLSGIPQGRKLWNEIAAGDIRVSTFNLNGCWVPLYNIHKIYAGLRDAYIQTNDSRALDMLIKLTDWMAELASKLTDEQIQEMLRSEHGGLNEIFADVAAITGKTEYIDLARRFSHRAILDPLLNGEDSLTGIHANTQIPKVIGYKRIADVDGDRSWSDAADYFWTNVTYKRSVSIGGNSVREHFHSTDDFRSMISSEQGPETCNTYNMLRLSKMLYETSRDTRYIDYMERALYNHILSSINPVQGGFVYFTPMRPGHYRVYSQPQTSFWCCVGSGMENHARYGDEIYAHSMDTVFINLYIPSVLNSDIADISQTGDYPADDTVKFTIIPAPRQSEFALAFRCPSYVNADSVSLTINGESMPVRISDGYLTVRRHWSASDTVKLRLPTNLEAERLPDGSDFVSFIYGPIVLAARTGNDRQDGLFADDSRGGHIASGLQVPLHELPGIIDNDGYVIDHVVRNTADPLSFRLKGLTLEQYENLELVPFADIRESRYMVYFPVYTAGQWEQQKDSIAAAEKRAAKFEAITIDKVICGEQQPESDHSIRFSSSSTGIMAGQHWRNTRGRISYSIANRPALSGSRILRINWYSEPSKDFSVLVNGKVIETVKANGRKVGRSSNIKIPAQILNGMESFELTITPGVEKSTPNIFEIRLIQEESTEK